MRKYIGLNIRKHLYNDSIYVCIVKQGNKYVHKPVLYQNGKFQEDIAYIIDINVLIVLYEKNQREFYKVIEQGYITDNYPESREIAFFEEILANYQDTRPNSNKEYKSHRKELEEKRSKERENYKGKEIKRGFYLLALDEETKYFIDNMIERYNIDYEQRVYPTSFVKDKYFLYFEEESTTEGMPLRWTIHDIVQLELYMEENRLICIS